MKIFAYGIGVGTKNSKNEWIEVYYPWPLHQIGYETDGSLPSGHHPEGLHREGFYQEALRDVKALMELARHSGLKREDRENFTLEISPDALKKLGKKYEVLCQTEKPLVATVLCEDRPPQSVPEAYLKLHLLSHRLVKPHTINLEGIFRVLPIVAWTSSGPIDVAELPKALLEHRLLGRALEVSMVDKFPRMTDYVVPSGVRIADATRVRLGAYLGSGTTVMQEGFVNFNAGTEGPNMVEGRISAGVFVGAGTDLGGGCSTMGTLSGGNSEVISIGKRCLVGANAGVGISLGDDCTVEAGLYVTAASKITMLDPSGDPRVVKARDLSGRGNLLFRRNSQTGALECLKNKQAIELNPDLHV